VKHLIREAVLYSAASGVALAVDVGLLWLLVEQAHLHYLLAATVAFLAGTAVVYALSVAAIFRHRRVQDRRVEFSVFAAIGVLGLLVNLTVLKVAVDGFGAHYLVGKFISIFFTFSLNFGLRRTLLFSAPSSPANRLTTRGSNG
jgi:putative flippase GtrA